MHKGYKCFHIPTGRLYISHDVLFEESVFPFLDSSIPVFVPSPTNSSTGLPNPLVQPIITGPCVTTSSQACALSPSPTEPVLSSH
jgi:hypothetical protein